MKHSETHPHSKHAASHGHARTVEVPPAQTRKKMIPMVVVFLFVALFGIIMKDWLTEKGVDVTVLEVGNLILFAASMTAFQVYSSALKSKQTFSFMQRFYTGFLIKFFTLVVAAILYFYYAEEVNKPAVFICMGIYLVYNFLSTAQVVKKK